MYRPLEIGWGKTVIICLSIINLGGLSFNARSQTEDTPDITPGDLEFDYRQRTASGAFGPSADYSMPTVRERDDEARIWINKITFDELPDLAEKGVDSEEVIALAEKLRRKYMRDNDILVSGFTRAELEELGVYLAKISEQSQAGRVTNQQTEELVEILRRQRRERGMTLYQLNELAAAITRYYRERGLFLAQAIIPAQEIHDGVVNLRVLPGTQGEVKVTGASRYSEEILKKPFENQIGGLVNNKAVEEGLYLLNDYPGLSVYGAFSAGENIGETQLNIDVREERAWRVAVRGDNHGSQFTGDQRLYVVADWFNPTGFGDTLSLGFLKSYSPEESDLGLVSYQFPVLGPRTKVRIAADYNEFNIANEDDPILSQINLEGTNSNYSIGVNHQFIRGRDRNFNAAVAFTQKESDLDLDLAILGDLDEKARGLELTFSADALAEQTRLLNVGDLTLQYGDMVTDVAPGRDAEFYKLSLNTSSLLFVPIPYTEISTRLVIKSRWQYSESALPAFEQFVLGGAQSVRAFTVRDFSADQAAYLGAEWYWTLPEFADVEFSGGQRLSDMLQLAVFGDAAYGVQKVFQRGESDLWGRLGGWGVLFKFTLSDRLQSQISVAHPTFSRSSADGVGEDEKSARIFADFTYFFD